MRSKGRGSFDTKVYMSHVYTEVFNCGLALIRLYMHIICIYRMYLLSGSFDTEVYIYGYIYESI